MSGFHKLVWHCYHLACPFRGSSSTHRWAMLTQKKKGNPMHRRAMCRQSETECPIFWNKFMSLVFRTGVKGERVGVNVARVQ